MDDGVVGGRQEIIARSLIYLYLQYSSLMVEEGKNKDMQGTILDTKDGEKMTVA